MSVFEGEGVRVGKVGEDEELEFGGESEEGRRAGIIGGDALGTVGCGYLFCCFRRQLHV